MRKRNNKKFKFEDVDEFVKRVRNTWPSLSESERRSLAKFLVELLDDDDPHLVKSITNLLVMMDDYAVPILVDALKDDSKRLAAAVALSKIGKKAVDGLIGLLDHPDEFVRWAAVWTLGEIGDTRALDKLYQLLENADTIFFALALEEAIAKIKDRQLHR